MRYYTYKVTFSDLPGYFYYGYHSSKRGTRYSGSPKTWKHLWKFFEPEVQVLQWYETKEEAVEAEKSILRATWKDPYSLNENVGGVVSDRVLKSLVEKGVGIHSEEYKNSQLRRESLSKAGRTGASGISNVENKVGLFSEEYTSSEKFKKDKSRAGKSGSSSTNSQKWECLVTGFVSNSGGLSHYQKKRGIPTSMRKRVR